MGWLRSSEQRRYNKASLRARTLLDAGDVPNADATIRRALRRIRTPELRSDLLRVHVRATIDTGQRTDLLPEAIATLTNLADERLSELRLAEAAHAFGEALNLACDPALHLQSVASPLATAPQEFFEASLTSATARAVRAPRGRTAQETPPSGGRPTNVLVVTRQNANFLGELLDHFEGSPQYRHRFIDVAETGLLEGLRTPSRMSAEILTAAKDARSRVRARIGEDLDWADVVFIEWCSAHAVLLNLIDPGTTRVVLRLHSYEAFTPWPHLLDFSRIDDLVFVSAHVRDLVKDALPGLSEGHATKLDVLPLGLPLSKFAKPKSEDARFTLGLIGWRQVAKDPLWSLEVVRRLRETDDRYRLMLVGDPFDAEVSAATRAYGSRLYAELAELEQAGAVWRWGRTDDVPGVLAEVGVILSSSVRESFHAGLVEGAASGAVPVVRDWPFFAGRRNGARTLFPPDWVVDTPEQAAARILEMTQADDVWRRTGKAASAHASATWDWDVVKDDYDRLFSR